MTMNNKYNPLIEEFPCRPVCISLSFGIENGLLIPVVDDGSGMIKTIRVKMSELPDYQRRRFPDVPDDGWLTIAPHLWGTETGSTMYSEAWSGLNGRLKANTEEYELHARTQERLMEILSGNLVSSDPDPETEPVVVLFPRPHTSLHEADLFPSRRMNDITLYVSSGELWHAVGKTNIEVREIFSRQVFAVAGASVGSEIIASLAKEFNPRHVRLTDVKGAHPAVRNRTNYPRRSIGDSKHHIMARWLYDRNPFMDVEVVDGGIQADNVNEFVFGNPDIGSPRADYVLEETDDVRAKMATLRAAVGKVNTLMATDAGHIGQIDFWKAGQDFQIGQVTNDELDVLYQSTLSDPKMFVPLLRGLLGDTVFDQSTRQGETPMQPRFRQILDGSYAHDYSGLPQLGSIATMNAAVAVQMIGHHILGYVDKVRRQTLIHALAGYLAA